MTELEVARCCKTCKHAFWKDMWDRNSRTRGLCLKNYPNVDPPQMSNVQIGNNNISFIANMGIRLMAGHISLHDLLPQIIRSYNLATEEEKDKILEVVNGWITWLRLIGEGLTKGTIKRITDSVVCANYEFLIDYSLPTTDKCIEGKLPWPGETFARKIYEITKND